MANEALVTNLIESGAQIAFAIPGIQVVQPVGNPVTGFCLIQADGLEYVVGQSYVQIINIITALGGLMANQVLQTTLVGSGAAIGFAVPGIKAVQPDGLSTTTSVIQSGGKEYVCNVTFIAVVNFINAVP